MDNLHQLSVFLQRVMSDIQLRPSHISLYTVLCQAWINNGCSSPFNISRSRVMKLAKIQSIATYHRVIHELISHGYILYTPSYHPTKGSEVILLEVFVNKWYSKLEGQLTSSPPAKMIDLQIIILGSW